VKKMKESMAIEQEIAHKQAARDILDLLAERGFTWGEAQNILMALSTAIRFTVIGAMTDQPMREKSQEVTL
jgi:hypothetical protein